MRKLIAGILSTLVVIGLMAPTGGFPSRPTFQAVTVTGVTKTQSLLSTGTGANSVASSNIQLNGSNSAQIFWANSGAGTDAKAWDILTDTAGVAHFRLINDGLASAADWMTVTRTGITSANVKIGGASLPHTAAGSFTAGVSTCTATATIALIGISTCAGNVSGQQGTVTFSPAFVTAPVCIAQSTTPTTVTTSVLVEPTTTNATVLVTAGALGEFRLICQGL